MLVLHFYLSNVGGADLDCNIELVLAFLNTVSFEMFPQYVLHLYLSNAGGAEHIRDVYCAAHLIDQKMRETANAVIYSILNLSSKVVCSFKIAFNILVH